MSLICLGILGIFFVRCKVETTTTDFTTAERPYTAEYFETMMTGDSELTAQVFNIDLSARTGSAGFTTKEILSSIEPSYTMLTEATELSTQKCIIDSSGQANAQTNTVTIPTLAVIVGTMGGVIAIESIALVIVIIRHSRSSRSKDNEAVEGAYETQNRSIQGYSVVKNEAVEGAYETPNRSTQGNEERSCESLLQSVGSDYEVPIKTKYGQSNLLTRSRRRQCQSAVMKDIEGSVKKLPSYGR